MEIALRSPSSSQFREFRRVFLRFLTICIGLTGLIFPQLLQFKIPNVVFESGYPLSDNYQWDAYGISLLQSGGTSNSYLYTGEQFDADLGMEFLRARYLNQARGQFLTRDSWEGSLTKPVTLHGYVYVRSNPIGLIDPTGHFGEDVANGYASATAAMSRWYRNFTGGIGGTFSSGVPTKRTPATLLASSGKLFKYLMNWESFVPKARDDGSGNWTIGYGHVVTEEEPDYFGDLTTVTITPGIALSLLGDDMRVVDSYVKNQVAVPLAQYEFDSLASLAFNAWSALSDPGLLSTLNSGGYDSMPDQIRRFSNAKDKNNNNVTRKLPGLVNRREADARMFSEGVYLLRGQK